MTNSKIIGYGLLHAILAAAYIALIASIISNGDELFGKADSALSPVAFLLTFVLSAAIMGIIIFGRPIIWFLDGAKKEALKLVFSTIVFLFIITGIVFTILIYTNPRPAELSGLIKATEPLPESKVTSPLAIKGEARGIWFFEASFPVILVDWDGKIITTTIAEAQSNWMTEDFVPFKATLEFEAPYKTGSPDFMKRGTLILKKDNPSGLPENDNALEIPVFFK